MKRTGSKAEDYFSGMRAVPLLGFLSGLIVALFDVLLTFVFAADAWRMVLEPRGLRFDPSTPVFFLFVNLLGGYLAFWLFDVVSRADANRYSLHNALIAGGVVWGTSRLYVIGFVTTGLMSLLLYAMFSIGLFVAYLLAVIVCREILLKYRKQPA